MEIAVSMVSSFVFAERWFVNMKLNLIYVIRRLYDKSLYMSVNKLTGDIQPYNPGHQDNDYIDIPKRIVSIASIRQSFFRSYISGLGKSYKDFNINDEETFPLKSDHILSKEENTKQHKYISATHEMFEDMRLEDAYGDYENCILCAEAILWCVENGFEYENLSY